MKKPDKNSKIKTSINPVFVAFEKDWLRWAAFGQHIILPWFLISVLCYGIGSFGDGGQKEIHRLVLVGFFSIYFLIIRSGLHIMSYNLHDELKRDFGDKYADLLAVHQDFGFLGLKIGATLARMKKILYLQRAEKLEKQKQAFHP